MKFEKLKNLIIPTFILFKNLKFKEDSYLLDIKDIASGEIIALEDNINDARLKIPKMYYNLGEDYLESLENDFGDREYVESEDGKYAVFSFNDSPYELDEYFQKEQQTDYEVFGESYTLLWLCPADVNIIVKSLINHIKRKAKQNSSIGNELYSIWVDYIDNISINSHQSQIDTAEIIMQVKEDFEKQVNLLPDKPSQSDWDFIEEMALK